MAMIIHTGATTMAMAIAMSITLLKSILATMTITMITPKHPQDTLMTIAVIHMRTRT
jgi:hypothetical protein